MVTDLGFQLATHAGDRFRIEAGLRQRQPHQLERRIAIPRQCFERAAEVVEIGVEAEPDRQIIEPALESLTVQFARALVQQRRSQPRQTRLVRRIGCGAAAAEGDAHGDYRVGMILDQPGFDAIGHYPLDLHGRGWPGECDQSEHAGQAQQAG